MYSWLGGLAPVGFAGSIGLLFSGLEGSVADVGEATPASLVGDCWGNEVGGPPALPCACSDTTSCSRCELISRRTETRAFSRATDWGD